MFKFTHLLITTMLFSSTTLAEFNDLIVLKQAKIVPNELILSEWPEAKRCLINNSINIDCVNAHNTNWSMLLKAKWYQLNGDLKEATDIIDLSLSKETSHHLNYFQKAVLLYQKLQLTKTGKEQWVLSMGLAKNYKSALEINPDIFQYRYYMAYHYLQTPKKYGGDPSIAFKLADDGVKNGQDEFYPVRADIYLALGNIESAINDYREAINKNIYKRSSFEKASMIEGLNDETSKLINDHISKSEKIISKS